MRGDAIGVDPPEVVGQFGRIDETDTHRLAVARAHLARAELAQAVTWGRRTADAAPWLEEAYQLLLRAYARQGQRTLALRIYDEAVANLHEELNISPSRQTERLAERLRRGEPI